MCKDVAYNMFYITCIPRPALVNVTATYQYPDDDDAFEREPFAARFYSPTTGICYYIILTWSAFLSIYTQRIKLPLLTSGCSGLTPDVTWMCACAKKYQPFLPFWFVVNHVTCRIKIRYEIPSYIRPLTAVCRSDACC